MVTPACADDCVQDDEESTPEGRTRRALRLAREALQEAQHMSQHVDQLPSAREAWQVPLCISHPLKRYLSTLRPYLRKPQINVMTGKLRQCYLALLQVPRRILLIAKPLLYAALFAGVWASHAAGLAVQAPVALLTGALIGAGGLRRGSLDASGEASYLNVAAETAVGQWMQPNTRRSLTPMATGAPHMHQDPAHMLPPYAACQSADSAKH